MSGSKNGHQRVDHRGNFGMVPAIVLDSLAWRYLPDRARSVLQIMQSRFNGRNNGRIVGDVKSLARALGHQNYASITRALIELITHGFIICTADFNWPAGRAREYEITYISTGPAGRTSPAKNTYLDWKPPAGKKSTFGASRKKSAVEAAATPRPLSVEVAATLGKVPVEVTATHLTESPGLAGTFRAAAPATPISNHLNPQIGATADLETFHPVSPATPAAQASANRLDGDSSVWRDDTELRDWLAMAIEAIGYGGARQIAAAAGIPESVLSKFRSGKGLPDHYRRHLQCALAQQVPWSDCQQLKGNQHGQA